MITIYRLKKKAVPYQLRCLIGDYIRHNLYQVDKNKPITIEWMGYYWQSMKFIIAVEDNNIIGYLSYVLTDGDEDCMIHTIYVDPAHRNKGAFKKMYASLRLLMKEKKIATITSTISYFAEHKNQTTFDRTVLSTNVRDYL